MRSPDGSVACSRGMLRGASRASPRRTSSAAARAVLLIKKSRSSWLLLVLNGLASTGADAPDEVLRAAWSRGERPVLLDGAAHGDGVGDGLGRYTFAACDPDDGVGVALRRRRGRSVSRSSRTRSDAGPSVRSTATGRSRSAIVTEPANAAASRSSRARMADRLSASSTISACPAIDFARYRAVWRFDRRARHRRGARARRGVGFERLLARLGRMRRCRCTR